jgi:hypothetical protein
MNRDCRSLKLLTLISGLLVANAPLQLQSFGAVSLFDHAFNLNGTVSTGADPVPAAVDASGFNFSTGLGTLAINVTSTGANHVGLFVDHEIDEPINTFFNEFGFVTGAPAAGQSWEIDEPGFVFGDIYSNFTSGSLDNSTGTALSDDVSMALAWDFILASGEVGTMKFNLSDTLPGAGPSFRLSQTDPDSQVTIYFSSSLEIAEALPVGVPESGSTTILLLLGFASLTGLFRKILLPIRGY